MSIRRATSNEGHSKTSSSRIVYAGETLAFVASRRLAAIARDSMSEVLANTESIKMCSPLGRKAQQSGSRQEGAQMLRNFIEID